MDCGDTYFQRFAEIELLADMAETHTHPGGNVSASNILTRSGLVLLCGYFEGFVREMSKEFVDRINDAEVIPSDIPIRMLSEHASICYDKIKQNKSKPFSEFILNVKGSQPIQLDSGKLSSTNANPTVDTIERLFNNFDIPFVLDELSINDFQLDDMYNMESQLSDSLKNSISALVGSDTSNDIEIIKIIESKWAPKKKRRRVGYLNIIDEILKKRNRIAHGEGFDNITPQELKEANEHIIKLCTGLMTKLNLKLAELTQ